MFSPAPHIENMCLGMVERKYLFGQILVLIYVLGYNQQLNTVFLIKGGGRR